MKMSLDGFQKVKKEGDLTTLKHPAGHTITIKHSILSPKMRGEIEALPQVNPESEKQRFEDGGMVNEALDSIKKAFKAPTPSPTPSDLDEKYKKIRDQNESNMTGETSPTTQKYYKDGGKVDVQGDPVNVPVSRTEAKYAAEEDAANKAVDSDPQIQIQEEANQQAQPSQEPERAPAAVAQDPAQSMLDAHSNAMDAHNTAMKLFAAAQNPQQPNQSAPSPDTQALPAGKINAQGLPNSNNLDPYKQTQQTEYQQEQNIKNQAGTQGAMGAEQGQVAQQAADQNIDLASSQAKNQKLLNDEAQNVVHDFDAGHLDPETGTVKGHGVSTIDPNQWVNSSANKGLNRAKNIFGLILGGIGGAKTGTNVGLDLINNHIAQNIDAQKTNAANQLNLYGKINENLNSDTASTGMLKSILSEHYARQLEALNGKYANPIAAQKAQEAILALRQQAAQQLQPIANLQTLRDIQNPPAQNGTTTGQTKVAPVNVDPATLIRYTGASPEDQDKIAGEIKNAQDINNLVPQIKEAFDMASSRNPGTSAQGKRAFEGLINTTVKETEGTARQAAFDSIHRTMTPSGPTALPDENEEKWKTVVNYLASKKSAPIAKAHGLDLERFSSTVSPKQPPKYKDGAKGTDKQGNRTIYKDGNWVVM